MTKGGPELLEDPVARELLASTIPARLAYVWKDGTPSVATLFRLFRDLDRDAFERALAGWLAAQGLGAGEAVALDGKDLRGIHGEAVPGVHPVAAFAGRSGAVLAQKGAPTARPS